MRLINQKIKFRLERILIILLFFILNNSCKKKIFAIGDKYQGGIIAYLLVSGDPGYSSTQHGIIAAETDQGLSEWGCNGQLLGANGKEIGTGNMNTQTIVSGCTAIGIPARLCNDLVVESYSDWYLPSVDELDKLFKNRDLIGGFSSGNYWSSTEDISTHAWGYTFINSNQTGGGIGEKSIKMHVRAVRSF